MSDSAFITVSWAKLYEEARDTGKYWVWYKNRNWQSVFPSHFAVVDDFGNLVGVPHAY